MAGMDDYKLLSEDEMSFKLAHPDGSEFVVAKEKLDPSTIGRISGLGPVSIEEEESFSPQRGLASTDSGVEVAPGSVVSPENYDQNLQRQGIDPFISRSSNPALESGLKNTEGFPAQPRMGNLRALEATAPVAPPPAANIIPPEQQVSAKPQAVPRSTAAQPGVPTMANMQGAQNQQLQGIQELANSQAKLAEDNAKIYEQQEKQIQEAKVRYEAKRAEYDKESERLYKETLEGKINPSNYWESKSTGNKVLAAISIMLGGLGAGLSRTNDNPALDIINQGIKDDIEAQKATLSNKQSLLSKNLERTRDLETAEAITRNQILAGTAAQIQKQASMSQSPMAKAQAKIAIGQLREQILKTNSELAAKQSVQALMSGGVTGVNPAVLPEALQKKYVPLGDGKGAIALDEDAKKKVLVSEQAGRNMQEILSELKQIQQGGLALPASEAKARLNFLKSQFTTAVKNTEELGQISQGDQKLIDDMFPDLSSLKTWQTSAKMGQLEKYADSKVENSRKTYLMNYQGKYKPKSATPGYTK